jgi:hypothetical protein
VERVRLRRGNASFGSPSEPQCQHCRRSANERGLHQQLNKRSAGSQMLVRRGEAASLCEHDDACPCGASIKGQTALDNLASVGHSVFESSSIQADWRVSTAMQR